MKQTLSFHSPIIASTQSKVDVEAFEKSTDAFEKGRSEEHTSELQSR